MLQNLFSFKNARLKHALSENKALASELSAASTFIEALKSGDLQTRYAGKTERSVIADSLVSLQLRMIELAKEEEQRNWINQGLAKFADLLRVTKEENAGSLFDQVISTLVSYLGINQGAIFLINEENPRDRYLELVSCYAYERKKYFHRRLEVGDGLVGQCFMEKQIIYMTDVPEHYVKITSGLGNALPRSILLVPMILEQDVLGVVELASFQVFENFQRDFVMKIAENMASTFASTRISLRTQKLLRESQIQEELLRAQEEEMRQNMEELTATQEEMQRKADQALKVTAEMSSIVHGINATMATIEFTPDGIITMANDLFLKVMNYSLTDIKGKHHRLFVPDDTLSTADYHHFWSSLAAGKSNADVFRRKDASGKTVWLNAIYNPILGANGEVIRVIKFASDITNLRESEMEVRNLLEESKTQEEELRQTMEEISATQEEMHRQRNDLLKSSAEMSSILNGINATMATVEFTPEGMVTNANENFMKMMGYSLIEIKGKHHRLFMPVDVLQTDAYNNFWLNLASGKSNTDVFRRINSKGKTVWLNAIYNPIVNHTGEVVKVMKFATDITEQKEKELEIQALLDQSKTQEEELRQTMEEITSTQEEMERRSQVIQQAAAERESLFHGVNSTMATIEFSKEGIVLTANPNFLKVMHYPLEQIKGKHHRVFVPEEIRHSQQYENFWSTLARGESITDTFKRINAKGETVWLNAIYNPILNAEGEVIRIMKMALDVSRDKQKEIDLHRTTTLLSLFTQATMEGLWDMDAALGEVSGDTPLNYSHRFRQLLGFENEEDFPNVLNAWMERLHPDYQPSTLDALKKHLADDSGKTPYDVECLLQHKDGGYKWFRSIGNTLRDQEGKPLRIAGSLIDIHHTKELQKQKKRDAAL